jgi:hypothetical protein
MGAAVDERGGAAGPHRFFLLESGRRIVIGVDIQGDRGRRAAGGLFAFALYLGAGSLFVLAQILAIGLCAAPFAACLGTVLVGQTSGDRSRGQAAAAGLTLGVISSFLGAALLTAVMIATATDKAERSVGATALVLVISTVSLGVFYVVPSMAIGLVWALASWRAARR